MNDLNIENNIRNGLVRITEILYKTGLVNGSKYGEQLIYGANYKNDIFMLHPQCWCDQEDCPWCGGCNCSDSAYQYYIGKQLVTFDEWCNYRYEYRKAQVEQLDENLIELEQYEKIIAKLEQLSPVVHIPQCDFCLGKGVYAQYGSEPGKGAPNFWYIPGNFKIWWYKYIGRDMEYNRTITSEEWGKILHDCLNSICINTNKFLINRE